MEHKEKPFIKRLKFTIKYSFIVWLLSLIFFIAETIIFQTPNGSYSPVQSATFVITIAVGSTAFLVFFLCSLILIARKLRVISLLLRLVNKTVLIVGSLLLVLGVLIALLVSTAYQRSPATQVAQEICNRTSPYAMPPALQRAISLVMQRYEEHNDPDLAEYQQMLNCLDIQFSDIHRTSANEEGYFTFDTSKSSLNEQVIAVDAAFNDYDDLTAAVVLAHELTHAKQYIDELAYHRSLSCVDKEVFAFKQEAAFYSYLNIEEQRSLLARAAQGNQNNPELAQLQQLANMAYQAAVAVNGAQKRAFTPAEQQQFDALLESKIRQMVVSIPEYQQQCTQGN